jgi:hypothetical protein
MLWTVDMIEKKNLLIIGASGGVAGALLKLLAPDRERFGAITLVDRCDRLLADPLLSPAALRAEFVQGAVDAVTAPADYRSLLTSRDIDIVIDLSVNETRPMLAETDAAGVCYLNTGIANRIGEDFAGVVFDLIGRKTAGWKRPHILCAGMNPGIVNLWVQQGIQRHGLPLRITHFEYDDGRPRGAWRPVITWSRETFIDEITNDPAGFMEGRDRLRRLYPNPLKNRMPMDDILSPILPTAVYPRGFLLLHEENLTIAQRHDLPSRFLFANDMRTMDHLAACYDRGTLTLDALFLGDNRDLDVRGGALIGVRLEYEDRWVYRYNRTDHAAMPGSSGSCLQVAAGLRAALLVLAAEDPKDRLTEGLFFCEDLCETSFPQRVEETLDSREIAVPAEKETRWREISQTARSTSDEPAAPTGVRPRHSEARHLSVSIRK